MKCKPKVKNYDPLPPVRRGPDCFLSALRIWGVALAIEGDRVIASGPGVSPVLQGEVDKRAKELIALLQ
jgi:hypothetical protein